MVGIVVIFPIYRERIWGLGIRWNGQNYGLYELSQSSSPAFLWSLCSFHYVLLRQRRIDWLIGQELKALNFLSLINVLTFNLTSILVDLGMGPTHQTTAWADSCHISWVLRMCCSLRLLSSSPCPCPAPKILFFSLLLTCTQTYKPYFYLSLSFRFNSIYFRKLFLTSPTPTPHPSP